MYSVLTHLLRVACWTGQLFLFRMQRVEVSAIVWSLRRAVLAPSLSLSLRDLDLLLDDVSLSLHKFHDASDWLVDGVLS